MHFCKRTGDDGGGGEGSLVGGHHQRPLTMGNSSVDQNRLDEVYGIP